MRKQCWELQRFVFLFRELWEVEGTALHRWCAFWKEKMNHMVGCCWRDHFERRWRSEVIVICSGRDHICHDTVNWIVREGRELCCAGVSKNSGRKVGDYTLINSMRASLNNIRSFQVRRIFHALRKTLKKLASVKSFCSSSLQTWIGSSFVTFAFGRCFKQRWSYLQVTPGVDEHWIFANFLVFGVIFFLCFPNFKFTMLRPTAVALFLGAVKRVAVVPESELVDWAWVTYPDSINFLA